VTTDIQTKDGTGNLCRRLQAETGWSTDTIAQKLQVTEDAAEQWLNGTYTPTSEQRDRAARLRHRYYAEETPIPELLDELKTEMRWNNKDLASRLDVTHAAISNWMRGYAEPSVANKQQVRALYAKYQIQPTLLNVIRALRDDTDLTGSKIAAEVGVARSTVSQWLREENKPKADEHRAMLRSLYTDRFSSESIAQQ